MHNVATQRVIALVDMDCFYCQVETRLNPNLKGKPMAVVQYNQWKGGGIIAVNYEARSRGVTRYMRGDEAKEICPEISLVSVPTIRGKADLSNYRDAGDEVAQIISEFSDCVQRASIDEAYLDLTKAVQNYIKTRNKSLDLTNFCNTYVVGYCDLKSKNEEDKKRGTAEWLQIVENEKLIETADYHLAIGAQIVEKMRTEILKRTGFHCSAGIAHNKTLAKLTASLHKPMRQTVLPQNSVPELYETLQIHKVRNLGGKLGKQVSEKLSINYMSELYNFTLEELNQKFDDKTSNWLYNLARGIDFEPVIPRLRPESIGCCKNFTGKNALTSRSEVKHWLRELALEISERLFKDLERNKRRAKLLTVSFSQETSMTRCGALNSYDVEKIVNEALELLKKFNSAPASEDSWIPPVKFLGIAASKFAEEAPSIEKYLKNFTAEIEPKKSEDLNSLGKTQDSTKKNDKSKNDSTQDLLKSNEKLSSEEEIETSNYQHKPSFFLKFLDYKSDSSPEKETNDNAMKEKVNGQEKWISLSEVFPDINEVETEVVENLPEALQKKFKERLKSVNGDQEENSVISDSIYQNNAATETCQECCKKILKSEILVHLDYHAAWKLHSEINSSASDSVTGTVTKKRSKEAESLSKRKKKEVAAPSKKLKNLTAFFAPLAKE